MTRAYDSLVVDLGGVLTDGTDPSWWRLPAADLDARARGMVAVVCAVRDAGLRTALLSNSDRLDHSGAAWDRLFDVRVVSGEVGLAKPAPEVYVLTARRLGVPPARCVFVDDLAVNVHGAVTAGMTGVLHTSVARTVEELEVLLDVPLPGSA
jgi:putative hydrolase of the HAD superfamily